MKKIENKSNPMRNFEIVKIVLSCGAVDKELEKSKKLLTIISGGKPHITKSGPRTRIPDFKVTPGMELGTRITLRNNFSEFLKRFLAAIGNTLKKRQIEDNHFSFGIKEYIEIPGIEYQRDIGIKGLNVTVVFSRPGKRVGIRKIKPGVIPKRQHVAKQDIINYMQDKYATRFI